MKTGKKETIKAKAKALKKRVKEKVKGCAAKCATCAAAVLALLVLCAGCLTSNPAQTTIPASRLTQAEYGDIYASITGDSNTVTFTIGDGAIADASGGGDAQTTGQRLENTPTQTTDVNPEIAAAWAGGSAGTGGSKPTSNLTESLKKAGNAAWDKLNSGQKITAEEAKAITDCANGSCEEP